MKDRALWARDTLTVIFRRTAEGCFEKRVSCLSPDKASVRIAEDQCNWFTRCF